MKFLLNTPKIWLTFGTDQSKLNRDGIQFYETKPQIQLGLKGKNNPAPHMYSVIKSEPPH